MSRSSNVLLIVLVITALLAVAVYTCAYTVKQHEQAVILAFGEVQGKPVTEPGLHFKVPWYEARKFDKRWLAWDGDPNQITTLDKRYILIDVFARWKIADPLIFIEKLRDEESAQGRLDDILDSATRNVIANHNLIEAIRSTNRTFVISNEERENQMSAAGDVDEELAQMAAPQAKAIDVLATVTAAADSSGEAAPAATETDSDNDADSDDGENADGSDDAVAQDADETNSPAVVNNNTPKAEIPEMDSVENADGVSNNYSIGMGRHELTEQIIEKASQKAMELGIELKDVRLKRIDYIPSVQESVFKRMISERTKVASRLRSQGEGLSAKILGRKDRDLKRISSEAYRKAEEIRGNADAAAARIYAEAYKRDPELYRFLKTLESYRLTLGERTWLLITTNSDYGTYLKSAK
ncbi:MAG: protease modulator HflC [Deltaproteobacteria bacterium]|nr:protease modulator HflC [Deltaproteobacteria bacterium]